MNHASPKSPPPLPPRCSAPWRPSADAALARTTRAGGASPVRTPTAGDVSPRWSRESFEALQELAARIRALDVAPNVWQLARGAVVAMTTTLRTRASILHHYDARTHYLRVIGADGPRTDGLLGRVFDAEDDFITSTVLSNGCAMRVRLDGELPRFVPSRIRDVAPARSIFASPLLGADGCVAILELVDVDERRAAYLPDACELVRDRLVRLLEPMHGGRGRP